MALTDPDFEQIAKDEGIPTTSDEAIAVFKEEVDKQGSIINNNSDTSPFWRLLTEMVGKAYAWLLNMLLTHVMPQSFAMTATGKWLDKKLAEVDLTRFEEQTAEGDVVFVRTPGAPAVFLSKGFEISTERINGVVYRLLTKNDTVLLPLIGQQRVEVEAELPGAAHNLGAGYYRIPQFALPGVAEVYNDGDWLTRPGRDEESDESARLRYRDRFSGGNWHIDATYRDIISTTAQVQSDTVYFDRTNPRGPGSANFHLLLNKGVDPAAILSAVNKVIAEGNRGTGDDMLGLPLPETTTDMNVQVWLNPNLSDEQSAALVLDVENFIRCAFRENDLYTTVTKVRPQSRFSISMLTREVHRQFPGVETLTIDIGDIQMALEVCRLNALQVTHVKD